MDRYRLSTRRLVAMGDVSGRLAIRTRARKGLKGANSEWANRAYPKKMGGPPSPKEKVGRPHAGYPESENSLLRSSSLGHRNWLAVRPRELRLPSPDGLHSIWFTNVSAVSLVESRINLLHCTLPRYCNVDETRDWFRLSNSKAINFSNRRRHYKKLFSFAQEAATYPLRHTLQTFSTVNSSR